MDSKTLYAEYQALKGRKDPAALARRRQLVPLIASARRSERSGSMPTQPRMSDPLRGEQPRMSDPLQSYVSQMPRQPAGAVAPYQTGMNVDPNQYAQMGIPFRPLEGMPNVGAFRPIAGQPIGIPQRPIAGQMPPMQMPKNKGGFNTY
jgi:hypothetical protein